MKEQGCVKLSITVPFFAEDPLANRLLELGVQGLQIDDDENRATVSVYFPTREAAKNTAAGIEPYLGSLFEIYGKPFFYEVKIETLEGEDWAVSWRKYLEPTDVDGVLWVTPTWIDREPPPGRKVIRLDPQMAFGTGSHETTRLALWAIARASRQGELAGRKVLDVGCGSGILAIAAVVLGAAYSVGVDTDPVAVSTSEENAKINGVSSRCKFVQTPLEEIEGGFDLVLANIDVNTLRTLAPRIVCLASDGARIVLTGLLAQGAKEMRDLYRNLGVAWRKEDTLGEWIALEGRREAR